MMNSGTFLPVEISCADCMRMAHEPGKVIPIKKVPYTASEPEQVYLELYRAYYEPLKKRVTRYIAIIRTDFHDADDILQNVFKKLWENKDHLHKISSPENYLFKMAKNDFLNSKKHLSKENTALQEYGLQIEEYASTTEEMVLYKEMGARIDQAISNLPVRMKETLKLKIKGYKVAKIAGRMGVSRSTVKNQLQVATNKMRACLHVT